MNITEKILGSFNKFSEEEQRNYLPTLKELAKCADTKKKINESQQNFFIQFTSIVGVVFGILAAFGNMGENYVADCFYLIGIISSLISLVSCIIVLFQPIKILEKQKEQNLIDGLNELGKAIAIHTGQQFECQEEKVKISPKIKIIPKVAYGSFAISLICLVIRHFILYAYARFKSTDDK